jgi:hypothetical protein
MITFVAAAYKETIESNIFINSLLLQDNPNWRCIIYSDEPNDHIKKTLNDIGDNRFDYYENKKAKGFWGHYNRKKALHDYVKTDFVIQASIQDYYLPNTVRELSKFIETNDFIFFDCIHNGFDYNILKTNTKVCQIDWGCFAARTDISKKIDIKNEESRVCDGLFVESFISHPKVRLSKINKILLIHN